MKRTFTAVDLVQLPKLDASSAQALGTEVLTAARPILSDKDAAKRIPEGVLEAHEDLSAALSTLNRAAATRLPSLPAEDTARAKAADQAVDAIWSGLHDVLLGWSKIQGLPEAGTAVSLRATLFPKGLKFTQIAYKLEWAESNTRILLIKDSELEAQIEKLGAGKILERLYEAHDEYGAALGITSPMETPEVETANVREALDELVEALRTYVVRVSGMVSKRDPTKTELAQQLLAPIENWQPAAARTKAAEPPAGAPAAPALGAPSPAPPTPVVPTPAAPTPAAPTPAAPTPAAPTPAAPTPAEPGSGSAAP
ncbi:hypothetical protein SOCEGT47_032260 [Sorangium cellulosum]|uniref:Uncharacterized protein n=1 Tax=Sorangium cellulosum TaxID=56 RepID=A0A4P2Q0N4_SORCE|nr:hypothetical protein [Sorangium cellulosum]AUX22720.1 hypothetical protein SOCEGT47_032260 [Sorangium cellulosum]